MPDPNDRSPSFSQPLDAALRVGARGSPLSVAQTRLVREALASANGVANEAIDSIIPFIPITTTGDVIRDRPLSEAGGKGLFTKELDEALLDGRIDVGVHSMKDLPTRLPEGIVLAAVPKRADPRDVFVSEVATSLGRLPKGAILGTASLRRQAQALWLRPDLTIVLLRGNVDTRLQRLKDGVVHATFLAQSGLERLGRWGDGTFTGTCVDIDEMIPAVGQGALALTARAGDDRTLEACSRINCVSTLLAITAERALLEALDGSCRTPIAAHAKVRPDGLIDMSAEAYTPDGLQRWRRSARGGGHALEPAQAFGRQTGVDLRLDGGPVLEAVLRGG
jgi:hydroxymethylbilane synthase